MKKRLIALLCVITCIFGLTACGSEKTYTAKEQSIMAICEQIAYCLVTEAKITLEETASIMVTDGEQATLSDAASKITSTLKKDELADSFNKTFEEYYGVELLPELGSVDGLLTTYAQMDKDMAGVKEFGNPTSTIEGKEVVVTIPVSGNSFDGQVVFKFSNDLFHRFIEGDASANTSFKAKMEEAGSHMGNAGLNTLLGMGSVFIVLILISFIIASFSLFKAKPKKEEVKPEAPAPVVEEVADDTELIAVIMAAISAYESANGGSADGFVVRSIKKANRRI